MTSVSAYIRRSLGRLRSMTGAFLRMDFIEEISYPMALVLSELGVLAPVIIYFFVGELVGDSPRVGGDYFSFAAIGIAVTTIMQSALSGFGGALQRAQSRGQFETFLVEPVPWVSLPFAMNLWRTMLGIMNGALMLLFTGLIGANYRLRGVPQFAVLILLGVIASMAIGILAASLMVVAKRSQPVLTLYGLVSSLLGGALFSVEQLPGWLRPLSWVIPHTYVINASRSVLMEDPGTFVVSFPSAVVALGIFDVIVLTVGLWMFMQSLEYARRAGILGGY